MLNEDRIRLLEKRVENLERAVQYNPFIGPRELPDDEVVREDWIEKTVRRWHDLDEQNKGADHDT